MAHHLPCFQLEDFMSLQRVDTHPVKIAMSSILIITIASLAVPLFAATADPKGGNQLQADTVSAWDEYIRSMDLRMNARAAGQMPFLWTDESANRRQHIAAGEILVAPMVGDGNRKVPHGLIHHWIGGVFIPGVTIDTLSAVMLNYGAYKDFYKPTVVDSNLLNCSGTEQTFWMRWQSKVLLVTAAAEGQYRTTHIRIDSRHGYNIADSIFIQEIENYGGPGEKLLPAGAGDGYVWKLHSIARYEQREGGVNLEVEVIALSRDIPFGAHWLVTPIVNRVSISSLTTTLQQTRDAAHSMPPMADEACQFSIP